MSRTRLLIIVTNIALLIYFLDYLIVVLAKLILISPIFVFISPAAFGLISYILHCCLPSPRVFYPVGVVFVKQQDESALKFSSFLFLLISLNSFFFLQKFGFMLKNSAPN